MSCHFFGQGKISNLGGQVASQIMRLISSEFLSFCAAVEGKFLASLFYVEEGFKPLILEG